MSNIIRRKSKIYTAGELRLINALHVSLNSKLTTYYDKSLLKLLVNSFLSNIDRNPYKLFSYMYILRDNSPYVYQYIDRNYASSLTNINCNIKDKFILFTKILSNHRLLQQWNKDMLNTKSYKRDYFYWKEFYNKYYRV